MALAVTKLLVEDSGRTFRVFCTITPSGSYSTGGDALNLSSLVPGKVAAIYGSIVGQAGYVYQFIPGANSTAGLMMVRIATTTSSNSPLAQHSAAAYDAAVVADVIRGEFVFRKLGLDVSG